MSGREPQEHKTHTTNWGGDGPSCDAGDVVAKSEGPVLAPDSFLPTGDEYFKPTGHVFDEADQERLTELVNMMTGAGFVGMATVGGRAASSWYVANVRLGSALHHLTRALLKFKGTHIEQRLTFLMQPGLATKASPVYNLEGWSKYTVAELNRLPLTPAERDQLANLVNRLDDAGRAYWQLRLNARIQIEDVEVAVAQGNAERQKLIPLDRNVLASQAPNRELQRDRPKVTFHGASTDFMPGDRLRPQGPPFPPFRGRLRRPRKG